MSRYSLFDDDSDADRPEEKQQYVEIEPSIYLSTKRGINALPSGAYGVDRRDQGLVFLRRPWLSDTSHPILGPAQEEIRRRVTLCLQKQQTAAQTQRRLRKRGYLLYGPPGNGKSTLLYVLGHDTVSAGGVVLITDRPRRTESALRLLRQLEPGRPILHIIEDIDRYLDEDDEEHLLGILDGNSQVDLIVHVATTNHPEDLPDRFTKRPGRFDEIIELGPPNEEQRRGYLAELLADSPLAGRLEAILNDSQGLTFAQLRELVTAAVDFGEPYATAIARVRAMSPGTSRVESPRRRRTGFRRAFHSGDE